LVQISLSKFTKYP